MGRAARTGAGGVGSDSGSGIATGGVGSGLGSVGFDSGAAATRASRTSLASTRACPPAASMATIQASLPGQKNRSPFRSA